MISNIKTDLQTAETDSSEFLILPDGKILAHNITPMMAKILSELNPDDEAMNRRARQKIQLNHELPS